MFFLHFLALGLLSHLTTSRVLPEGVGRLPALGWNTWNMYYCDISEEHIISAARMMKQLGLQDAGYEYVNIDDCWSIKDYRDSVTQQLVPDPVKFPRGIKHLADDIHDMGFKVGIYSSAGEQTCAFYPASLEHEEIDASTFAAWGIDYVKYDNCGVPDRWKDQYTFCVPDTSNPGTFKNGSCVGLVDAAPPGYDWTRSKTALRFRRMRDALERQNRTMLYSLCEWGQADVTKWGNDTASSWRMSGDIVANWGSVMELLNQNSFLLGAVDFWGHNDPDMLEVGNGNLTYHEQRSHFALWAAMKSPLIIGTDLKRLSDELVDILRNPYLIAFNQDPIHGKPAKPYKWGINPDWTFNASHPAQFWSGDSVNGILVLMLNTLDQTNYMRASWSEIPELEDGKNYAIMDLWTGEGLGCDRHGFEADVASHDSPPNQPNRAHQVHLDSCFTVAISLNRPFYGNGFR